MKGYIKDRDRLIDKDIESSLIMIEDKDEESSLISSQINFF